MPALTDGTLTTTVPHYYNSALDTTGGYVEITDGQCRFLDVYVSAKTCYRYGTTAPASPRQGVLPAGSLSVIPQPPNIPPGTTWQVFFEAATATIEISVTAHNNAYFSAG